MLVQNRYVSAKPTKIELTITSYCNSIFRLSLKIEFIPAGYVRRIFRLSLKLKKSSMNTKKLFLLDLFSFRLSGDVFCTGGLPKTSESYGKPSLKILDSV